jgi:hypothetical protein
MMPRPPQANQWLELLAATFLVAYARVALNRIYSVAREEIRRNVGKDPGRQ